MRAKRETAACGCTANAKAAPHPRLSTVSAGFPSDCGRGRDQRWVAAGSGRKLGVRFFPPVLSRWQWKKIGCPVPFPSLPCRSRKSGCPVPFRAVSVPFPEKLVSRAVPLYRSEAVASCHRIYSSLGTQSVSVTSGKVGVPCRYFRKSGCPVPFFRKSGCPVPFKKRREAQDTQFSAARVSVRRTAPDTHFFRKILAKIAPLSEGLGRTVLARCRP